MNSNIIIIVILLLLTLYSGKLLKQILSAESYVANYKYIKSARFLSFMAVIGFTAQCITETTQLSFGVQMIIFSALSGLVLIIELCLVIITKGNKWQYMAICFFLLSVVYIGYKFNEKLASSIPQEIYVTKDMVELRGSYVLNVPFKTISKIDLMYDFPNIAYRNNGISIKDINMGYYVLKNGENSFLFLANKLSPFIHIERDKNIPVFVNCITPGETIKLYKQLLLYSENK